MVLDKRSNSSSAFKDKQKEREAKRASHTVKVALLVLDKFPDTSCGAVSLLSLFTSGVVSPGRQLFVEE